MSGMTLLQVTALSVRFGKKRVLSNVSLRLERGTVLGVIGADGAGKTSLLRSIVGLVQPTTGNIRFSPGRVGEETDEFRAGFGLGYVPQQFSLYEELSLEENLSFFGSLNGLRGKWLRTRMEELFRFTGLAPFRRRRAGALSGGMKQKLSLAACLLHNPACVILDEPTNGVDPVARHELWDLIGKLRKRGVGVLVSTQYLDEAEQCDRVLLLHEGRVIQCGRPDELRQSYPYRMWVLPDSEDLRMEAEKLLGEPGIRHVYARGSDTVLVITDERAARETLERWRRKTGAGYEAAACAPSMEDVFISLVEEAVLRHDPSAERE